MVNKPELKIKEFDRYKEFYCGVCRSLGNRYNFFSRLTLSYDSAFAAILLTALFDCKSKKHKKRCVVHPCEARSYISNEVIDYVADMNLVMSYYKCLDDWKDEKSCLKLSYGALIKNAVKSIKKQYPKKVFIICNNLNKLAYLEKNNCNNVDLLADTFGNIMGEIFMYKEDSNYNWNIELRKLGYYLGKFIYILDALDDVEDDIKNKSFNPFAKRFVEDKKRLYTQYGEVLEMIAAQMARSYERLPIVDDLGILRNIIYSGIWNQYNRIIREKVK